MINMNIHINKFFLYILKLIKSYSVNEVLEPTASFLNKNIF